MIKTIKRLLILVLSLSCSLNLPVIALGDNYSCKDIEIIFARGSGQKINDIDSQLLKHYLTSDLSRTFISYNFYELGEDPDSIYKYPAISVDNFFVSAGAFLSGGDAYAFGESVKTGSLELKNRIDTVSRRCLNTRFILVGYSQGATVITTSLNQISPTKILYVATLGDPKLRLPEGYGSNPPACRGINLSEYRAHVPDCRVFEGSLRGLYPYRPYNYYNIVGAWCNQSDFVCGSEVNTSAIDIFDLEKTSKNLIHGHVDYTQNGSYSQISSKIMQKLKSPFKHKFEDNTSFNKRDTVILFDSTGSMSNLIGNYKSEALKLARSSLSHNGRIALYEYRDLNTSDPNTEFAYRKLCDFSCNLSDFKAKLDNIRVDGGGDLRESALYAMKQSMQELNWRNGATKSLILITDAPFHNPDLDGTTIEDVVKISLSIDPVNIFIVSPSSNNPDFNRLSELTNGKFFNNISDIPLSSNFILRRPSLSLNRESYEGYLGEEFYFEAVTDSEHIDHFEWDLDADGIFELSTITPSVSKIYQQATSGFIQVKIVDQNQYTNTMSARLSVKTLATESPENLNSTSNPAEQSEPSVSDLILMHNPDRSVSLSFQYGAHTTYAIINLNDGLFKITNATNLKIKDLDNLENIEVTITPISNIGKRGIPVTTKLKNKFYLGTTSQSFTMISQTRSETLPKTLKIKAPNAGVR